MELDHLLEKLRLQAKYAIGGIGMLAVGIIGGPVIGAMSEKTAQTAITRDVSAEAYQKVAKEGKYVLGKYNAVDADKVAELATTDAETAAKITTARNNANQGALSKIAIFPGAMLLCYIGLILYFRTKGGYKPVVLTSSH